MYLLAISGGPDSMFLLNWYKKKKVVVAHVNYHKREDSDNDENIVREFCLKHSIPFEVLNVTEKPEGNFQDWAREIRYTFFKEVYDKYKCDALLMAHHKDDFLETALMQQRSNREPKYYGIRKTNEIKGMNIVRPFIKMYWKDQILEQLAKDNIKYATDYTNALPEFERNKIRLELKELPFKEKKDKYKWFIKANKILVKKFKEVDEAYKDWERENFSVQFFREELYFKQELAYDYIHAHFKNVKVSSGKVEGLVQFIEGKEGGKYYMLDDNNKIKKENGIIKPN